MASAVDIKIVANTKQASRELRKLGGGFAKLDRQSKRLGAALSSPFTMAAAGAAAAGTAVVALSAALIKNAMATAALGDEFARTARVLGVTNEETQQLSFLAGRARVDFSKLSSGLKRLQRNMLDATTGNKRMAETFERLGIRVQDSNGRLRNVMDVSRDLADAIKEMGQGADATGTLMLLLGRAGTETADIFLQGSQAFDQADASLRRLGGYMSNEAIAASEAFESATTDLRTSVIGLRSSFAEDLLPTLTDATERMTTLIAKSGRLRDALSEVADTVAETTPGKFGTLFAETQLNMLEKLISAAFPKLTLAAKVVEGITRPEIPPEFQGPPVPAGLGVPPADTGVGAGAGGRGRRAARPEQLTTAGVLRIDPQDVAFTALMGGSREDFERATAEVAQMQRAMYEDWAANEEMKTAKAREEAEKRRQIAVATAEAQNYAAQEAFGAIATFAGIAQQAVEDSYFGQTRAGKDAAKALFATAKLAALAGATVNTALAITNALANVPAPANIAAAVGVGIAGAAEIGVIAATAIQGLADGGLAPGVLKKAGLNNHTVIGIRNDEAVIDPVGTKEITQMLSLQRRQMEMNVMGSANDSRPVVLEMDGRRLTRSLEPHLTRSVEDGSDFRQNVRFAGAL